MRKSITKALAVLAFGLLASCSPEAGRGVKGTIDRVGEPITVTVTLYENRADLNRAYIRLTGEREYRGELWGFARWNEWKGTEPEGSEYTCSIHSFAPRNRDDNAVLTLGHELLHCLYGEYHPE